MYKWKLNNDFYVIFNHNVLTIINKNETDKNFKSNDLLLDLNYKVNEMDRVKNYCTNKNNLLWEMISQYEKFERNYYMKKWGLKYNKLQINHMNNFNIDY